MHIPSCVEDDTTQVLNPVSDLISVAHDPVGRWFEACLKRQRSETSVSVTENDDEKEDGSSDENDIELSSDEVTFLMSLDPAEWKKQDHYRVLGISHLRSVASDEDIKQAYRKKVLRHHPDKKDKSKKARLPSGVNEHGYFTCITMAFETLSTKAGRQAYDSVDPTFDDSIPSFDNSKDDFFKVFGPAIERNARWSQVQPVLLLGDANSSQEYINQFYSFWYEFKSWRNFSYLDEEDPEKAESREERRWMERQNKHMRQKKKKEEIHRIRSIIDLTYQNDFRLKKFKEEEKQKKLELKQAKELAAKEKEQQRLLELEKENKLKAIAEQEAKEKAMKEKKEKDKLKKAAARDRKIIRQSVKGEKFFDVSDNEVTALEKLEKALENLSVDSLQDLREKAEGGDKAAFKQAYFKYSAEIFEYLKKQEEEKRKLEQANAAASVKKTAPSSLDSAWSDSEKQLLVKATTLFPVGTASRWDVIAAYINEHSGSSTLKTGKQVISKVKNLKKLDPSLKEEVNQLAYKNLEKSTSKKGSSQISNDISIKDPGTNEKVENPWTSDEQKLLEQALKMYGASTPERWEKIASIIPTRTKKECMRRYKELVEIIKAKKAASAS